MLYSPGIVAAQHRETSSAGCAFSTHHPRPSNVREVEVIVCAGMRSIGLLSSHQPHSLAYEGVNCMAARCDVCLRKPQYGSNVSHSNRHTNRRFLVNVQHRRIMFKGKMQNVYICTRCLRTMVKVPKER